MGHPPLADKEPEYQGLGRSYIDAYRPAESHLHGCPAAWYRNEFVASLIKYERRITEHGFSSNVLLDRCADPLVLECIRLYEREVLAVRAHIDRIRFG